MEDIERINEQGISFIIGARDEAKTVALTIGHLMEECWSEGIRNFEIILMDNGSEDETSRFFAWKLSQKVPRETYIYSPRGMVYRNRLRIFYDPVFSNVGTRNKGANLARYENLIFADAHIVTRHGTVRSTINTLEKYKGIVHAAVSWLGSDPSDPSPSYQYSYKVGEKIWGTWNRIQVSPDPFYIPISGHCWLAVKKKEFLERKGYPYAQRVYGGGEPYLDTKFWLTGGTSMVDPNSLVYHLSAGRGYSWHNHDLIHNMFLVSYILGGKKWADRILMTYLNKGDSFIIRRLYDEAIIEGEEDKKWLDENKKLTFEELLRLDWVNDCNTCTKRRHADPHPMRLWDVKNQELHGNHRSMVAEFKLERRDGKVFIGETELVTSAALEIASLYV